MTQANVRRVAAAIRAQVPLPLSIAVIPTAISLLLASTHLASHKVDD
jgi:hypothetical protein